MHPLMATTDTAITFPPEPYPVVQTGRKSETSDDIFALYYVLYFLFRLDDCNSDTPLFDT
jgi:hypothetical protein